MVQRRESRQPYLHRAELEITWDLRLSTFRPPVLRANRLLIPPQEPPRGQGKQKESRGGIFAGVGGRRPRVAARAHLRLRMGLNHDDTGFSSFHEASRRSPLYPLLSIRFLCP
jgi:hypothetical protein